MRHNEILDGAWVQVLTFPRFSPINDRSTCVGLASSTRTIRTILRRVTRFPLAARIHRPTSSRRQCATRSATSSASRTTMTWERRAPASPVSLVNHRLSSYFPSLSSFKYLQAWLYWGGGGFNWVQLGWSAKIGWTFTWFCNWDDFTSISQVSLA